MVFNPTNPLPDGLSSIFVALFFLRPSVGGGWLGTAIVKFLLDEGNFVSRAVVVVARQNQPTLIDRGSRHRLILMSANFPSTPPSVSTAGRGSNRRCFIGHLQASRREGDQNVRVGAILHLRADGRMESSLFEIRNNRFRSGHCTIASDSTLDLRAVRLEAAAVIVRHPFASWSFSYPHETGKSPA